MSRERAVLAGGCFWGMEDLIRTLPGIIETTVGYTGGQAIHPTYENHEGHAEAIEVIYDNARITYRALLEFFFSIHNPCTRNRQGNDVGTSYRSAIFYLTQEQKETAQALISEMASSGKWPGEIVTEIVPAAQFHEAEAYHQDYLKRYPEGYSCHFIRPEWKIL